MRKPRYPIYIPSKGRAATPLTIKTLTDLGVLFNVVVEPCDYEDYLKVVPKDRLLKLPFENLGQGSIPARNWIWEHALEAGARRHWIMDDNIQGFVRFHYNRKIPLATPSFIAAMEDFTDRYTNVAFSGPSYRWEADERVSTHRPFRINTKVYSCTLLNSELPYRWRGRYNEDTDICLRALKDGWCTIRFNAFLSNKIASMQMKGGNTDTVYATGDHRLQFVKSLKEQHPDCVELVWRYDRWHHAVDYTRFKSNALRMRDDITPTVGPNEYGMVLRRRVNVDTNED